MTNSRRRHAGWVGRLAYPFQAVGLCLAWVVTAAAGLGADPATGAGLPPQPSPQPLSQWERGRGEGSMDDVVVVRVRSTCTVTDPHILVGDVADVQGGSWQLRQQIVRLDLADAPRARQSLVIPANQIACRIRLARIDARFFLVPGSGHCDDSAPAGSCARRKREPGLLRGWSRPPKLAGLADWEAYLAARS